MTYRCNINASFFEIVPGILVPASPDMIPRHSIRKQDVNVLLLHRKPWLAETSLNKRDCRILRYNCRINVLLSDVKPGMMIGAFFDLQTHRQHFYVFVISVEQYTAPQWIFEPQVSANRRNISFLEGNIIRTGKLIGKARDCLFIEDFVQR